MKKIFNWKSGLILIILLAAFLRLWQLGSVPKGISDDEAAYIYNAYSISHTGKDILGVFLPLSFNAHSSMSPVPVYLIAPFVGTMGLSAFSGRLPAALVSIGSVFLLFLITDFLFKNKRIALISALLLAISPWALQLGRNVWDVDFAAFFLLFGIYIFITKIDSKKFLWSLVPFLFAFYSYHATKIYFIFLIPVLIFFFRKELLKRKKEMIVFLCGCLLIGISFLIVLETQGVTRQTDVFLLKDKNAAILVNWERQYNSSPWKLRDIFSNKPLYYLRVIRENYLEAFSTNFLFLYGDVDGGAQIDNIHFRGVLYVIELPLLLLGIYWLLKNKNGFPKKFLLLLLLIAPLPSTFTVDRSFVTRDIMMLPVLMIIVACGLAYLLKIIAKQKPIYKYLFISVFVLFYLFLFSEYVYQYYYRWSTYGAEGWQRSYIDLVYLINSEKNNYNQFYISGNSQDVLLQYSIFNKVDPNMVQRLWSSKSIKIDNITMFNGCFDSKIFKALPKGTFYASLESDCHYDGATSKKIVDESDPLRTIWNIYENK